MTTAEVRPVTALPRERLSARTGWHEAFAEDLVAEGDRLHLASASRAPDGSLVFAQPIPDSDPWGSFGGRTLPRGLAISGQGDVYLADPAGGRILYTRASLPPASSPADPVAPFVPLYTLPEAAEPAHPLRLTRPVALGLVPAGAGPGTMADALLIADGARLLWLDRRHILLRHQARLPGQAIALGIDGRGQVRVAVTLPDGTAALITLVWGRIRRSDALARIPHSVHVMPDGTALLADHAGLWAVAPVGAAADPVAVLASGPLVPRALTRAALTRDGAALLFQDGCAGREPLRLALPLDRVGALGGTGLPLVTLPRRLPRPRRGVWIAGPFDGEARGFAWHRIALDAVIPEQCRLVISTHVTDFEQDIAQVTLLGDWSGRAAIGPADPPEALVQRNRGRYLWLRIEAFGNGQDSAAITGIDLFGPRRSQMNDLPAPFRQDPESADFLDRFLSLQDLFLAEVLALYHAMGAVLRPAVTPPEFIDWLGGWFDWQFLAEWSTATRREMIASSMGFFARRGTIGGLEQMLRWHIGPAGPFPLILEDYRLARAAALPAGGTAPVWIGGTAVEPGDGAHAFSVVLPAAAGQTEAARRQIDRIIAAQKPAHTVHRTIYVAPGLRLAQQARLGIDAILPDSRPQPLGAGRAGEGLWTVAQA